jgi:hypothetical protein
VTESTAPTKMPSTNKAAWLQTRCSIVNSPKNGPKACQLHAFYSSVFGSEIPGSDI